jgi:hypothetical protein
MIAHPVVYFVSQSFPSPRHATMDIWASNWFQSSEYGVISCAVGEFGMLYVVLIESTQKSIYMASAPKRRRHLKDYKLFGEWSSDNQLDSSFISALGSHHYYYMWQESWARDLIETSFI